MSEQTHRALLPGDSAPWFFAPCIGLNPRYAFHTVAGRNVLLLFFGSASNKAAKDALGLVARNRDIFDDENAAFFGITVDPDDATSGRLKPSIPGIRFIADFDQAASRLYGAANLDNDPIGARNPRWFLLDSRMTVKRGYPLVDGAAAFADLRRLLAEPSLQTTAPVLHVTDVFERDLCLRLIEGMEAAGGEAGGVMKEINGKTVRVIDELHKRRTDWVVEDADLIQLIHSRVQRRLVPQIARSFQFRATRMERLMVGRYDGEQGGHFLPHRDNTTKGTAHRRFAVTINLNADSYDGGELRFPEFGRQVYKPSTGSALVFSCSLLHEALPVKSGSRYAFLPFLYDEEAARMRENNNRHLSEAVQAYNSTR